MSITRTIKTTSFTVNVYDMTAKEILTKTIVVSGDKEDTSNEYKKEVKRFERVYPEYKVLDVVSREVFSGLYAMSEETFLQYAERIGDGR